MNRTVLIADDNANARIIAETLLRLRDLDVRLAADGTEVCDIVRRQDIAVVVLELDLAGMNGFELVRRLHGRFGPLPPPFRPRILAATSRQEADVERFVMRLGADAFLRKPFVPGELIAAVERLMAARSAQSGAEARFPTAAAKQPRRARREGTAEESPVPRAS